MIDSPPSLRDLSRTFLKIGLLSFGGPAGQIALMHRFLVDEKKWIGEQRYLHALNFCMLLPGPEAMQLATYCGWLLRGVSGAAIAGLLFILPGFAVMLALSAAYLFLGDQGWMAGLLFGLKAAVLALVLEALMRVSKRALKDRFAYGLAVMAFAAIALFKLPFPLVVLTAAIVGASRQWISRGSADAANGGETGGHDATGRGQWLAAVAACLALWAAPLAMILSAQAQGGFFHDAALFFSKAAIVTFGGAYAVLVYVGQQAVDVYGWLRPGEMVTGLGLAETTPGPLILVLVFVAFVGGSRVAGLDPLTGGMLGGLTALWFTFVPSFLFVFAGAPFIERLRHVRWLSAALAAVTASVVGVIANLALWFGLHVVFGGFGETSVGPLHLPVIDWAATDWKAVVIALASAVALLRFHANLLAVLAAASLAGVAATLL